MADGVCCMSSLLYSQLCSLLSTVPKVEGLLRASCPMTPCPNIKCPAVSVSSGPAPTNKPYTVLHFVILRADKVFAEHTTRPTVPVEQSSVDDPLRFHTI